MNIDTRDYPAGYLLTEVVARQLGCYVHVANFSEHEGRRMFRMIIDGELGRHALAQLLKARVLDGQAEYVFSHLEVLSGPVVDQAPRRGADTPYLRVTLAPRT